MAVSDSILGLAGLGLAIGVAAFTFSLVSKAVKGTKNKSDNIFGF